MIKACRQAGDAAWRRPIAELTIARGGLEGQPSVGSTAGDDGAIHFRTSRPASRYGSITEGKLLSGLAGHKHLPGLFWITFPARSSARPVATWRSAEHPVDSTAASHYRIQSVFKPFARHPVARLQFAREIAVCSEEPMVYFRKTETNLAKRITFSTG
jgi:hypothetical protein